MAEATEDLDKICNTLDKLTLDALSLMEEEILLKLNVENAMCGGESHLAKARYIMGQNSVSCLQLPTENSPEFSAVAKVYASEDDKLFGEKSYELQLTKKTEDESVQDPVRWFGVLVPQNLNYAQNMFRQALQWAVQAVNVQTQLEQTIIKIQQLKAAKAAVTAK
ncbi:hypothetical protein NQ314_018591 [Rhamnusium bicolor]|uniref:Vacuolar ATPase assembly protein VMA22 n=1 Tax=Rhamnusium bicolor TaxID=1586634 RepID=A0AAV8WRA5_9CUCU|nr:hypothetical protein NQ314_018591 [Rhamnusium bicolor]